MERIKLIGTEKQIAWAEKIRARIIAEAQLVLDDPIWQRPGTQAYRPVAERAFKGLCIQDKASFWIERKDAFGGDLMTKFAAMSKKKFIEEGEGAMFRHPNQFIDGDRTRLLVRDAVIY